MKKTLQLRRQTLRQLQSAQLETVAGGGTWGCGVTSDCGRTGRTSYGGGSYIECQTQTMTG